jgi:hypothetical protein
MNIKNIMQTNNINLEWLFTLSKLNNKEGLMYFNPIITEINNHEFTDLEPQCFLIDGAKFLYDESMDRDIIIHSVDKVITFNRIDGIQLNINMSSIVGFPFRHEQFKNKMFLPEIKQDHVLVS